MDIKQILVEWRVFVLGPIYINKKLERFIMTGILIYLYVTNNQLVSDGSQDILCRVYPRLLYDIACA